MIKLTQESGFRGFTAFPLPRAMFLYFLIRFFEEVQLHQRFARCNLARTSFHGIVVTRPAL